MSNLSIRKKSLNTWLHTDSVFGDFIISKFYFNYFEAKFQIVEEGNTRLERYEIANITLYDDTNGGTPETFSTITELSLRLEELQYPAFDRSGGVVSISGLIEAGTNVTITGSGTTSDPYVINSSGGGGTTPNLQEVLLVGNEAVDIPIRFSFEESGVLQTSELAFDHIGITSEEAGEQIFSDLNIERLTFNDTENTLVTEYRIDKIIHNEINYLLPSGETSTIATLKDLESGYIPLSGTPDGSIVTGALEFEPENIPMLKWKDEAENYNDFFPFEQGFSLRNNETEVFVFYKQGYLSSPVDASETVPENKLIYAQRQYVDNQFGRLISLTETEILAIASPENGRLYYNSDINQVVFYNATEWRVISDTAM